MVLPWGDACEPGGELRCEDNADGKADCDDTDCVNSVPCQPSEDGGDLVPMLATNVTSPPNNRSIS